MRRARRAAAFALAAALAAGTAPSASGPTGMDEIDRAAALLDEAEAALSSARGDEARRQALAVALQAHEAALAVLREGIRRLAETDRRLADGLEAERMRAATVLGAWQSLARAPRSAVLTHPEGALAAARTALLLADLTPRLRAEIAELGRRIDALRGLRIRQEIARAEAKGTLAALQALRAEASRRGRAARRHWRSPEIREALRAQAAEAAARARDLEDLARTLRATEAEADARPFEARRGRLPLPVAGRITGSFGGVDPWGRTGQGVTVTAPAYAEVRAPVAGTVRYAGPLIDYGEVVILEPEAGWLMVLAGLGSVDRGVGETVTAGARLGDLGGPLPSSEEFLLEASGAVPKIETTDLYLELRQAGTAVDPAPWFAATKE